MGQKTLALVCLLPLLTSCGDYPEVALRKKIASQETGSIQLSGGVVELTKELTLAPGAHDLEIIGNGTMLKVDSKFQGRAVLVVDGARNIRLRGFAIAGGRDEITKPIEMVPPENALRVWYPLNGILADRVEGLEITDVHLSNVVSFAILVSRSSKVRINGVVVEDSGSKNAKGRNNLSGGILIEEGTKDFQVEGCSFFRILGNALWTHSLRTSPRLEDGRFARNRFQTIGRDAIQVGHATRVRVEENTGSKIGYPAEIIDEENGGTPVAIDTAGNVDHSIYERNQFEEVNGKCMDLDGFHDGAIRSNRCRNLLRPEDYQFGHFGIVMNNTDPDAHSENIELTGNTIDGAKYGGLFLMGSGHRVTGNKFLHVNLAACPGGKFVCVYTAEQPRMLSSGIYLGRGVARPEETRGNVIEDNEVLGHDMDKQCIIAGPGVSFAANKVGSNKCTDESEDR